MNELEQLNRIKSVLGRVKEEKAKLEGQIISKKEELMKMGFTNMETIIEDAEAELIEISRDIKKKREEWNNLLAEFKQKFPKLFEG